MDDPHPTPNVLSAACPSRGVIEALAEKWTVLILHVLLRGPRRTGELRREIDGISEKMLIQSLRKLERNGFVARTAHAEVPPRVDYALTPLGASLAGLVAAMDQWVEANLGDILLAQGRYDSGRPERSAD